LRPALRYFVIPAVVGFMGGFVSARLSSNWYVALISAVVAGALTAIVSSISDRPITYSVRHAQRSAGRDAYLARDVVLSSFSFRKGHGEDTWHFCSNCSNWPKSDYETRTTKPPDGECCNECQAKMTDGDCKPSNRLDRVTGQPV